MWKPTEFGSDTTIPEAHASQAWLARRRRRQEQLERREREAERYAHQRRAARAAATDERNRDN